MPLGLLFAVLAAFCTAGATMLQAIGARHVRHYRRVDPRLLLSVFRSGLYIGGLGLLTVSFVLTLFALANTPLFAVQAITAASLAVVAALSAMLFGTKLARVEWAAVAAVFAGVVLLVIAERPSASEQLSFVGRWAMLAAAVALSAIAFTACRALAGASLPALLAGLAFGDAAIASRVVARVGFSVPALFTGPDIYTVAISGLLGTLLYATALQRGNVTAVFAMSTVGQTVGPAAVGWFVLGDGVEPGMAIVAAIGFAVTVGGAIVLGRHAHPEPDSPTHMPHVRRPPRHARAGRDDRETSDDRISDLDRDLHEDRESREDRGSRDHRWPPDHRNHPARAPAVRQ